VHDISGLGIEDVDRWTEIVVAGGCGDIAFASGWGGVESASLCTSAGSVTAEDLALQKLSDVGKGDVAQPFRRTIAEVDVSEVFEPLGWASTTATASTTVTFPWPMSTFPVWCSSFPVVTVAATAVASTTAVTRTGTEVWVVWSFVVAV